MGSYFTLLLFQIPQNSGQDFFYSFIDLPIARGSAEHDSGIITVVPARVGTLYPSDTTVEELILNLIIHTVPHHIYFQV